MQGDDGISPCPHCGACVLAGTCCVERTREARAKWQAEQTALIAERPKHRAKRKYLARLLFQFSGGK